MSLTKKAEDTQVTEARQQAIPQSADEFPTLEVYPGLPSQSLFLFFFAAVEKQASGRFPFQWAYQIRVISSWFPFHSP